MRLAAGRSGLRIFDFDITIIINIIGSDVPMFFHDFFDGRFNVVS